MRTLLIRTVASILVGLLTVSCGTVRESRQFDAEESVLLPRVSRAFASPVVTESELRRALEALLPEVNVEETQAELRRLVREPRFHGRRPNELRVVVAGWGSGPMAVEEIARGYGAFCAATRRTHCI